jgi:hypothetical protein
MPKWATSKEEVYKRILELRGCECCCLDKCTMSNGFCVAALLLGNRVGVCVLCKSHFDKVDEFTLPIGSHLYFESLL